MHIIVVAGGTGGHIFPALATVNKLREYDKSVKITWITTDRGREQELAKQYNLPIEVLNVEGIKRELSLQPIKALFKTIKSFFRVFSFIKKEKVDKVIAFGGYVCAPVLMASRFRKIPYFVQEQNSVPGIVNKAFSKRAKKVYLGMPLAEGYKLEGDSEISGTPVRSLEDSYEALPKEISKKEVTVLICGGSQGALSMNRVLFEAVDWMLEQDYQVIWQSGETGYNEIKEKYKNNKNLYVAPSFDELYPYYNQADILIGRSGASTISEAMIFGLPSIFIPLPWSAENHQWFNAGFAEDLGWAYRVSQDDNSSSLIIEHLKNLKSVDFRKNMGSKALASDRVNASTKIAKEVIDA